MRKKLIYLVCMMALMAFAVATPDAFAERSFYVQRCQGCHGGSTSNPSPSNGATCMGCHHHGGSNFTAEPDRAEYAPGDTVMVTLDTNRTDRGGWIRAELFDKSAPSANDAAIATASNPCPSCPPVSGVGGVDGITTEYPATLIANAPSAPGTYTWSAAWFGNIDGSGHERRYTQFTFSVVAPDTNTLPTADAGTDQTLLVGDTVTLDGSGSSDVDGNELTFSWSLTPPVGSSATLSDPTAVNPTFVIDVFGTYVAELTVNDGMTDSDPSSVTINTDNSAPVADAGQSQNIMVGDTVTLDGSASFDVDGDGLTFSWSLTLPVGSTATLSDSTVVNPSFVADVAGTYGVELIVNDSTVDSQPSSISVIAAEIEPPPNTAPVADAGQNQSLAVGDTVYLDGSSSSDADSNPLTFFWSFVKRPEGSSADFSNPLSVESTFVADVAGTYTVQLIVNDGFVDSEPDTVMVTAAGVDPPANTPPVADAGQDQNVSAGSMVALNGNGSSDADGNEITFSWTFSSVPPGSSPTLSDPTAANPTFMADGAGDYMVQLIVNDGTVDSAPDAVVITAAAVPQNTGEPSPLPAGDDEAVEEGRDGEDDEIDDDEDKYESEHEERSKSYDRKRRFDLKRSYKHERKKDRDDD